MTKFSTVGALAVAVVGSSWVAVESNAETLRYRASGDWSLITDGFTPGWGPNVGGDDNQPGTALPGTADTARINFGNNTVTVSSNVPTVNRVQIGVDESGILDVVNGGVLTTDQDILTGNNNFNATGTFNVNDGGIVNVGRILWAAQDSSTGVININEGGTVNVASHLWWGVTGTATATINGTLNQTGGILGLGTDNANFATGGTAAVTVGDGGLLALNNISGTSLGSIQSGSTLTITGTGELTLPNPLDGDFIDVLTDYADAGRLLGDALVIDTTKNPGFTTAYLMELGGVTGDYNSDGFVSQGDLDLVLLNWGDNVSPPGFNEDNLDGGGPFDGLVSQNELDGVLLNWGIGTPPSITAVPEPTTALVLAVSSLGLLRRKNKA